MTTALVGFGQDLLASAAQNFTPQYADSMQNLLFALAQGVTGLSSAETQQDENYAYAGDEYYGDDSQVYAADDGYYGGDAGDDDYYGGGQYDPGPEAPAETYPDATSDGAYSQYRPRRDGGIRLDAAILAQQISPDNQVTLRPVRDGDVLYDGRGDPSRGDKIKLYFASSCDCYVYIIGVDATGYVAQIFPEGNLADTRAVRTGQDYLVPSGTTWWGLDDFRGIENIYFIASRARRSYIEQIVSRMAGTRPPVPGNYRPVTQPAEVPVTRGLVQVQDAAPTSIPTEFGGSQSVSPTSFQNTVADADLVVSRWFRHE